MGETVLRWTVFTRGLNRAIALPDDPTKKPVVRADGKRDPPRLSYARWPDAEARVCARAAMDTTAVTWRGEAIATLGEWDAFCRAVLASGADEPIAGASGVAPARIAGAWDAVGAGAIDVAADTVWVVADWWAARGVRMDGARVCARFAEWRAAPSAGSGCSE